jgi:hypothetical protein
MRTVATIASCLLVLVAPLGAQQKGKDKPEESSKPGACETCEVRAYLLNKERAAVDIEAITAVLVIEGKDKTDLLIPLERTTPKTGERNSFPSSKAPREVEGTAYFASLITVHGDGGRRSEADDADRRLAKGLAQDLPAEVDKSRFTLDGPCFRANLTQEQVASLTCNTGVRFTIKGSVYTARGFSCSLSKGDAARGVMCQRVADDCSLLERHLKANEMDKAGTLVDRMSASLSAPCGEAACQSARHGCTSCCKDLRAAISAGNREKALEVLSVLKSQCSPCTPSKSGSKTDGDRK